MDKKILSTAIAGVLAGSMAFAANADVTLYGQIDLSIDALDVDNLGAGVNGDDINMNSNYSAIGVKGSEDLGNGLKAIFMAEFQYDAAGAGGINTGRDQWIGLDGSFGKVRFGAMSTPYKATGAMIDPLWRTALDSRDLGLASALHSGSGEDGHGRATKAIAYDTPDFNGLSAAATYSFDDDCGVGSAAGCADDDAYSLGARYKNGPALAFVDYVTSDKGDADEAWKIGGKYAFGAFGVYGQYEVDKGMLSDRGGAANTVEDADLWYLGGSFTMGNAMLTASYGQGDDNNDALDGDNGYDVWRIAGVYNFSKRTMTYAGFAQVSEDCAGCGETDQFSVGMRHKF